MKWTKWVCGLLTAAMLTAGCGGPAPATQTDGPKGELVVYTSQPEKDIQKLIEEYNQVYPDVKVVTFRSGTEEVISKVMAEKKVGAVQADVLLVADVSTFEGLKGEGLLAPYESPELAAIDTAYVDPGHTYVGTKAMATGIMINTDKIGQRPQSFADLMSPAYADQMVMPSPLYSGAAAYNLGVILQQENLGWGWYEGLQANRIKVEKGNGAVQKAVQSGEKAIGIVVDYLALRAKAAGAPVDFIYPTEGSLVITEPIGIVANTPHRQAAESFVDFILSKRGQEVTAQIGYTPIRTDVAPPQGYRSVDELHALSADIAKMVTDRAADKDRFARLFHS